MPVIPYGKHSINDEDIDAVVNVLRNEFLTQGKQVPLFEKALCDYTGATYCTAVNSATSGLHVACLALGVGEDDIAWTSANSFAASANCARYCGATVDFVDIDVKTGNICPTLLAQKLRLAAESALLPKVLIVVHFAGNSCEMKEISRLCSHYNVSIIEDAAHSLGASYDNQPVGSCQYSDFTVLSFHPVKSITSAEGGAILCNDKSLAEKCRLFSQHGITKHPDKFDKPADGGWFYQQTTLGYNYRLSDLHAALGISQLARLDTFVERRRRIAQMYFETLGNLPIDNLPIDNLPIIMPPHSSLHTSAWHLFVIRVPSEQRAAIFAFLQSEEIGVNVHYIPIYKHPYYQANGFDGYALENTEAYYASAISLPIFPELDDAAHQRVVEVLKKAFA